MDTKEQYISLLDILSLTRDCKTALAVAADSLAEASKAIQSAEQLVVADVLQGRKLVAFAEADKTE